jgi:hypothetical protein
MASSDGKRRDKLSFFLACAQEQTVEPGSKTMRWPYLNRTEEPPTNTYGAFVPFGADDPIVRQWWSEFLEFKFEYLALALTNSQAAMALRSSRSAEEQRWSDICDLWEKQSERERLAYCYRYTQVGDADIVKDVWYNDLPACARWAEVCRKEVDELAPNAFSAGFEEVYSSLVDEFRTGSAPTFSADHMLSWVQARVMGALASTRDAVQPCLAWPGRQQEVPAALGRLFDGGEPVDPARLLEGDLYSAYRAIVKTFSELASSGFAPKSQYIRGMIRIIKEQFQCAICDYLEFEPGERREQDRLKFVETTLEVDEETREKLEKEDRYGLWDGITGSILLAGRALPFFHVGTNDLGSPGSPSGDPRQSPAHRIAYEQAYGPVSNFWVFPIFEEGTLAGAFRVIDRLGEGGEKAPEGWTLYLRVQLAMLATLISEIWDRLVPDAVSVAIQEKHQRGLESVQGFFVQLGEQAPRIDFLNELLQHFEIVARMRDEKRPLGCCLAVVQASASELLNGGLLQDVESPVPSVVNRVAREKAIPPLVVCGRYYKHASPMERFFIFTAEGSLRRVCALPFSDGQEETGADAIARLSALPGTMIVFLMEPGHDSVHLWQQGKEVGDYFLFDRAGVWKLRMYKPAIESIAAKATKIKVGTIDLVYRAATILSHNRQGGMLIVGRNLRHQLPGDSQEVVHKDLSDLEPDQIAEKAGGEGAVLVSDSGVLEEARFILSGKAVLSRELSAKLLEEDRGARHRAAVTASILAPDALVVVVSENRGIAALRGGEIILWDH